MEKEFFNADKEKCVSLAMEYVIVSAGLNREGKKFQRMRDDALQARQAMEKKIQPRGQYVYYSADEIHIEQDTLTVGGENLRCKAFEQIRSSSVKGLSVYACSVGDCSLPKERALNQVYADIWGTALVDAARCLMKQELGKNGPLSDSFGPGFYGMGMEEIHGIKKLLDFDQLGIEVKESGALVPVKSCAGLYFHVNSQYKPLGGACASCRGNARSCVSCQFHMGLAAKPRSTQGG